MASSYTSNSGIEKPAEGDQTGEWGDTVNTNMDIIDRSINGVGAITLSGTTHTLTTTDGTLSDGMYKVLVLGGSPSGTNTITISPNDQDKVYIVVNGSGQTATFTQGSGGNVSVLNGDSKIIYADGNGTGAAVVDVTANLSFSSVNIDGGTIDGTVIGGASAAAGTFTTVTASGEIDGASLDISGNADIDGTLEADAMTLNGTAITTTATLSTGISNTNVPVFTTGVADDDFLRVAGTSIEGRSAAEVLSDIGASAAAGSGSIVTTGALDSGSITSGFGTINNGSSAITTTGLISGGSLDIDDVVINGSTIGHTDDTDLITVANGVATVAGEVSMTTLDIGGTNVTSTASELNKLDGATVTTTEINYLDITTLGTSEASKAVTVDSNGDLLVPDSDKFKFGAGSDMQLYHDGTNSYITNGTGILKIATETSGIAINIGHGTSEVTFGDNVTITGDFTVNGTTTTINTTNLTVTDPLVKFGQGYTGTAYDEGFIVTRGNGSASNTANKGFIWDESADEFAAIACNTEDGTTAGNVTINSYADLQIDKLTAGSLDISGDADIDGTLEADAMTLNGTAITATATLSTGISNTNVPVFTSGVADDDFLRVAGTSIEGRSAAEVLSDIGASAVAGSGSIVTTGALNSGSITSGFGSIDNGSSAITTTGVITGGTVEATTDTAAGDNAAIGYTSAEGLILTGQGSTSDVTIKNDADATVLSIPTGTTKVGIGTTAAATKLHIIDSLSGGQLLVATSESDNAEKYGTFGTQHYDTDQEPVLAISVQSAASENNVLIGGALGEFNAATSIKFYTAANATTTTGTERMRIDSSGKVAIGTTTAENPLTIQDIGGSTFNRDFAIRNGDATNYHRLVLGYNAASAASGVPTNAQFILAEKGGGYGTSAGLVVGNSDNAPVMFTSNATERMRIAADGNIAIGTTGTGDNKLTVEGGVAATNGSSLALKSGGGANSRVADLAFYGTFVTPDTDTGQRRTADITSGYATGNWGNEYLAFGVGTGGGNDAAAVTTERMRIAGDGKVGIGTTAPDSLVEIASGGATTAKVSTSATNSYAEMIFEDGNAGYGFQVRSDGAQSISAGSMVINDRDTGSFPFVIKEGNATNTVVLSGSNTCFNSTAIGFANQRAVQIQTSSTGLIAIQHLNTEVSGAAYIWFTHNGNPIGSIVQNGTSGLTYNTSSDYRLKENVNYTFDATTRLKQLKPARFNFITDREKGTVDGFLAHEVQEVVPEAVTGEKDGEEMQGIDQSKLVPLLVKTIQELEARITALEAG